MEIHWKGHSHETQPSQAPDTESYPEGGGGDGAQERLPYLL